MKRGFRAIPINKSPSSMRADVPATVDPKKGLCAHFHMLIHFHTQMHKHDNWYLICVKLSFDIKQFLFANAHWWWWIYSQYAHVYTYANMNIFVRFEISRMESAHTHKHTVEYYTPNNGKQSNIWSHVDAGDFSKRGCSQLTIGTPHPWCRVKNRASCTALHLPSKKWQHTHTTWRMGMSLWTQT